MSHPQPVLYVKTGCPWCAEALEFLSRNGIAHETVVVSNNPAAMQEMMAKSGQTKSPVLDWHGEILADFGEAELAPFLKKLAVI